MKKETTMKISLIILLFVLLAGNALADNRKASRIRTQTLGMNHIINNDEIDRVGSIITNRESGEELFANCEVRNANGECELINYVLQNNNQNYIVYNCQDKDCKINIKLKILANKKNLKRFKSRQRYQYFSEDSEKGKLDLEGDFMRYTNGSILTIMSLNPWGLVFLPITLAVDIALLPVLTINSLTSIKYVRGHQDVIFGEDKIIETNKKKFNTFLDSLVSYKNY